MSVGGGACDSQAFISFLGVDKFEGDVKHELCAEELLVAGKETVGDKRMHERGLAIEHAEKAHDVSCVHFESADLDHVCFFFGEGNSGCCGRGGFDADGNCSPDVALQFFSFVGIGIRVSDKDLESDGVRGARRWVGSNGSCGRVWCGGGWGDRGGGRTRRGGWWMLDGLSWWGSFGRWFLGVVGNGRGGIS